MSCRIYWIEEGHVEKIDDIVKFSVIFNDANEVNFSKFIYSLYISVILGNYYE